MTTRSVILRLKDEEARTIDALQEMSGEQDLLSRAVMKTVDLLETSFIVGKVDQDRMSLLREKAAPYRDASGFSSEDEYLNED